MLGLLSEIVLPALRGGRAGCRVRVKPSWSGRVYGTYNLAGRHFLLALVFAVSATALCGRLANLNLAEPDLDTELQATLRSNAHHVASRTVSLPARGEAMRARSEELFAQSRQIETILGVSAIGEVHPGMGNMDGLGSALAAPRTTLLAQLAIETTLLETRFARLGRELELQSAELRFTPSIVPIQQAEFVATSPYGKRISPFTRLHEFHRGLDLAADMNTHLVATADGVVVHVEPETTRNGMGHYVVVNHDGRFQTWYGHCARVFVKVGETVRRHQLIAEVGSSGRSTGPHVHYEVRRDDKPQDPHTYLMLDPAFQAESQLSFN